MRKFPLASKLKFPLASRLTTALLACALAPCAWAQTPDAKSGEMVRERRANASKDESAAKDEARGVEDGAAVQASDAGDAEVAALREQLAAAKDASARGRLQQSLAERLAQVGRKTEAVELLRSMLAEERFDPQLFYNTGNALARLGESESAIEAYRKAVAQRRGNYARAQHNLGVVLTRLGRWEEAQEALTAALRLENFTYAEASYSLGRLHALRGEAGLAIAEWTRTLRLKPDHADAAVALARALAEDGDPESALAILDAFASRANRRGADAPREVTVARGEIVAASNVEIIARREKGSARGAKNPGAERELARVSSAISSADATDASVVVREARRPEVLRPIVVGKQTYELLRRARAARDGERKEEAAAFYRRAIESNGGFFAPANLELGYTLAALNREPEAVESLLAVIRREGARYPVAFYHLGRFYEHMGRFREASESYARATELMGDDSPQFYVDLSRTREREGRYADALAAAVRYVHEMEKTGGAPDWALARVANLQKKLAAADAKPAKN